MNRGASISAFLKEYLDFRLQNISLHDEGADSLTITLDTLSLLHLAHLPDRSFEKKMNELPVVASRTNEHYFVSGFFLSSEREVYAHVAKVGWDQQLLSVFGVATFQIVSSTL